MIRSIVFLLSCFTFAAIGAGLAMHVVRWNGSFPWDQTACVNSSVYRYKQSYWEDTGKYCLDKKSKAKLGGI